MSRSALVSGLFALGLLLAITACDDAGPLGTEVAIPVLLSVQPAGGSTGVSVGANVVITFDHAIGYGMESYAALHEGDVSGPEVVGAWSLSDDRTVLTFVPDAPLKSQTAYTIHLGGGMRDQQGRHLNLEAHGLGCGGQWASGSSFGGGHGFGSHGQGQGGHQGHMGEGWEHPNNGSYGMLFTFTTA